jgi:hypothetical protein
MGLVVVVITAMAEPLNISWRDPLARYIPIRGWYGALYRIRAIREHSNAW